jgi:hypothetical protein
MDAIYMLLVVALFGLSVLLMRLCTRLEDKS